MISLKLKLLAPRGRGTEQAGNCGYFAASKERQKSSISQKIVTISMQNSDRDGFGDQTVDPIYHIPQEFCFLFRRTHVILTFINNRPVPLHERYVNCRFSALENSALCRCFH